MQEQPKPKLVYILGTGHSGSTLLDLILSTDSNTVSLGGFRYLDFYLNGEHGITHDDSGYTAADSPMWAPIADEPEKFLKEKPVESTLSFRNRLSILLTGTPTKIPHRYYNDRLYRFVQRQASEVYQAPVEVIVDSSKTLARLIELEYNSNHDVYVIHLVRDVRGVVNSNRKKGKSIVASLKYWFTDNMYASRFLRHSIPEDRQYRLRYENIVADPDTEIKKICDWLGLSIDTSRLIDAINKEKSYRFSGNEMRRHVFSGITLDDKWKTELPIAYRLFLTPLQWLFS